MHYVVSGSIFKKVLRQVNVGAGAVISFRFAGAKIYVQRRRFIIADCVIPVSSYDTSEVRDFSIVYNNALNLIKDELPVQLIIEDRILSIKQNSFICVAEEVSESRMEPVIDSSLKGIAFNSAEFSRVMIESKSLGRVMKELGSSVFDLIVFESNAYIVQANVAVLKQLKSPDFTMNGDTARDLHYFFEKSALKNAVFDYDGGFAQFSLHNSTELFAPVLPMNMRSVEAVQDIIIHSKNVSNVNLSQFSNSYKDIFSAFNKVQVDLMVFKDSLGLFIEEGKVRCILGEEGIPELTSRITLGQLYALISMFKDSGYVDISRSGNCLIFSSRTLKLILSGLIT